jgi:apolipoprotein N-acyltransferase
VAAVGSGIAVWLAFPGHDLWPLAPIGIAVLALATRGRSARHAFWLGLLAGWAMFVPVLSWSGIYVGRLPWLALATLEALYVAVMAALMPAVWRAGRGRLADPLAVVGISGLWVAQEAARSRTPFGGFPWARIAFSQADSPLAALASLGGAPAVTAGAAAIGGCLAVAARGPARGLRAPARRPGGVAPGIATPIVAVAVGLALLFAPALLPRPTSGYREIQEAAIQGDVPEPGLEFNSERRAVLDNHARATQALADEVDRGRVVRPDLVIWPENASDIDPTRNPDAAVVIQATVDRIGVPVVVGTVLEEPTDHLSNTSIVWGPSTSADPDSVLPAGPGQRYVKRHPAPFAEYIPYRGFFRHFSDKVDLVRRDFVAGTDSPVLDVGSIRLADVICFEVAYDDLVRDGVREGGQLLVVQTNNATFGYSDESVQQLAMSRIRAVETGRAVVHISTVGVSALIAPDGSVLTGSGLFTEDALHAALPLRTEQTLAVRLGAVPELALAALGLLLAGLGLVRRPPRARDEGESTP